MQQRIRSEMASKESFLLQGIVEADETYIGGRPRNKKPNKRGRGTKKTPVIGAVERGGKVLASVAKDLSGKGVMDFLNKSVNPEHSLLITDEYKSYNAASKNFNHAVINHSQEYVQGSVHTNTIEGVWSLLKRSWYGSHHHYTKNFTPLFIAETCWKYNNRKNSDMFSTFLRGCFA